MASNDERADHAIATRRGFLGGGLLLAGTALSIAAPAAAAPRTPPPVARSRRPVIALHADQLYLDYSGSADAYAPPAGLRALDDHDEDALRHLVYTL